jgi:hypothetical protein
MDLGFFDVNAFLGDSPTPQPGAPADAAGLLALMDRNGIDEALVYHAGAVHYEAGTGNEALAEQLRAIPGVGAIPGVRGRLHPSWVVMPPTTGTDPSPADLARALGRSGVKAVRILPSRCGSLRGCIYGPLLRGLADAGVVALIDFELPHYLQHLRLIDWDGLDWLLGEYPALPVVLIRVGQAVDRALFPLLDRRANLHIETSYYLGAGALERLCGRFGAHRALFGTGMPRYTPGAAVTLISYSGLDGPARGRVAGDNLRAMLARVAT